MFTPTGTRAPRTTSRTITAIAATVIGGTPLRKNGVSPTFSTIAPSIPGQPSAQHWGEGFGEISDWRVGPDGALWYCRQSTNFAGNSGSIGRVYGPGVLAVPGAPSVALSLRLRVSPAVRSAEFAVRTPASANLKIVDTAGRVVRRLADARTLAPGTERSLVWDGRDEQGREVAPGVYVAFLDAGSQVVSRRVVLLR